MEGAYKILRRSVHAFLQNYQYFTTTSSLLALPFSVSIFLSQSLLPFSSFQPIIQDRLLSLFDAAGFPSSSEFFLLLCLKVSQTISSFVVTLPFTLLSLLLAKASVIQFLNHHKPSSSHQPPWSSFLKLFNPLLVTQVWNSLVILSVSSTCFSLLFFAFNFVDGFGLSNRKLVLIMSAAGGIAYCIFLANALIICSMAMVLSGMERRGGYIAILKACILIKGRTTTALSLALPINIAMAAVETLFQFRIVRPYHHHGRSHTPSSKALEGMFISYLYSILLVLDTIIGCVFFKSCKRGPQVDEENGLQNRVEKEQGSSHGNLKPLEDVP